jgi:hypothetical protein
MLDLFQWKSRPEAGLLRFSSRFRAGCQFGMGCRYESQAVAIGKKM